MDRRLLRPARQPMPADCPATAMTTEPMRRRVDGKKCEWSSGHCMKLGLDGAFLVLQFAC
jgi:hypothetical protein